MWPNTCIFLFACYPPSCMSLWYARVMKKTVLHSSSRHDERHLVNGPLSFPVCFFTPILLLYLSWTPPKLRPGWYGPYDACLLWLCWICEPGTLTTVSYQCSATPIVCVVAVANEFVLPAYPNVCSGLSSDHLPVLNDVACREVFQNFMSRPDFTRMENGLEHLRIAPWLIPW